MRGSACSHAGCCPCCRHPGPVGTRWGLKLDFCFALYGWGGMMGEMTLKIGMCACCGLLQDWMFEFNVRLALPCLAF